jgi:hypothetical protein
VASAPFPRPCFRGGEVSRRRSKRARPWNLGTLIARFIEEWKKTRPDPEEPGDNFDDRRVSLNHTFGGAGKLNGDLTPECAAALQAARSPWRRRRARSESRTISWLAPGAIAWGVRQKFSRTTVASHIG